MSCYLRNKEVAVGKILNLFVSQKGNPRRMTRREITVDENGVFDDKFYGKNPERSILITSIESYNLAQNQNIDIEHGVLGENLLIDYNPYSLNAGTQIRIGEVILEISQSCTLCKSLTKIDSKLPKLLKNDRGVFAKVIKSGSIYQHDEICVMYVKHNKDEVRVQ